MNTHTLESLTALCGQEGVKMNHHEQQPKQEAVMTMSRKMMNTMRRRGFGRGPAGLALIWLPAAMAAAHCYSR